MRLTLHLLGVEVFDLALNEPVEILAEAQEFEPYQDAGSTGCTVIGFAPPVVPFGEMDCPPHQWDPSEGDEDV